MSRTVITEPRQMTISNIFVLPVFKMDRSQLVINGFINSYLFNKNEREVYDGYVLNLLFKPPSQDKFADFVVTERRRLGDLFLDEYDCENECVVLVYKIPNKYYSDIDLLFTGAYSKLSKVLMEDIPKTVKVYSRGLYRDETHLAHLIHQKNKGLKTFWEGILDVEFTEDMEVWERKTREEETLDENKINKYYEFK